MPKTEDETKALAQNRAMTSIINQLCDIIEEQNGEIDDLKAAIDMNAAHIYGLGQEHRVYFDTCCADMNEEDFKRLWKKGRKAFREGKDKWSTDEHKQ